MYKFVFLIFYYIRMNEIERLEKDKERKREREKERERERNRKEKKINACM